MSCLLSQVNFFNLSSFLCMYVVLSGISHFFYFWFFWCYRKFLQSNICLCSSILLVWEWIILGIFPTGFFLSWKTVVPLSSSSWSCRVSIHLITIISVCLYGIISLVISREVPEFPYNLSVFTIYYFTWYQLISQLLIWGAHSFVLKFLPACNVMFTRIFSLSKRTSVSYDYFS